MRPTLEKLRGGLQWAMVLAALLLIHGESLWAHMANAADPLTFSDDARQQIWPFLRYHDPRLFRDDYIADYYLSGLPAGYRLLMATVATAVDPRAVSKALPYLLLAATLASITAAAHRLGGMAAAWGALALALSSQVYLLQTAGGLPRAFGFPVMAAAAAALVYGRPLALAATAGIGVALYPAAGVAAGLALAISLLLLPAGSRGGSASWSLTRRLGLLVATGALMVALTLPTVIAVRPFGPLLGPAQVAQYPEIGEGGRYVPRDQMPHWDLAADLSGRTRSAMLGAGRPWSIRVRALAARFVPSASAMATILLLAAAGVGAALLRDSAMRRLMALPAAALAAFALANLLAPYLFLSERYVRYGLPPLLHVLVPAGLAALASLVARRFGRPWLGTVLVLVLMAAYLLAAGGRGPTRAGLSVEIPPARQPIYRFIGALPINAMVAGWPDLRGGHDGAVVDNVPYLSARRILLSAETHQVFHEAYTIEMRRRMRALIDAYFATESAPLLALRDRFRVTHLVIDRRHYDAAPTYFRPFGDWAARAFAAGRPAGFEAPRRIADAGVFDDGTLVVLDLSRLP